MKVKYLLLTVFLGMVSLVINAADWQHVLTEDEVSYNGIYFIDANTGWFVGDDGYLAKTEDAGANFTEISTGISEDLEAVFFLNADTGYVADDISLYKTTDGGESWTNITVPFTNSSASIVNVFFANSMKGWVMATSSKYGQVMYTTDGGANWQFGFDSTSVDMEDMSFYDSQSGIVVGGGSGGMDIRYTTDGVNWNSAALPSFPSTVVYTRTDLKGVYMVSKDTAYVVGWGSMAAGLQPSILLKSTDGGATWTYLEQDVENRVYGNLYDVYFKDSQNGLAVGAGVGSILLRTTDGGENWIPTEMPSGSTLYTLSGEGDNVFVYGSGNTIYHSTDFGDSWELLSFPSSNIYTISAPSDDVIYAAGYNANLFKSEDGGQSWKASYININFASPNVYDLHFLDENIGFAVHAYGMVSKTTDGGETWEAIMAAGTSTYAVNYDVYFFNEDSGVVIGRSLNREDIIYKTSNGGESWDTTEGLAGQTLNSVDFGSSLNGAIVTSDSLRILYTNDGGETWAIASVSAPDSLINQSLEDVAFVSAAEAVAVGEGVILRTTDGGASWTYVQVDNLTDDLYSVGISNGVLYALGVTSSPFSAKIYQSADAGASWSAEDVDNSVVDGSSSIQDMAVSPSGNMFIAAYYDDIYAGYVETGVEDDETVVSKEFALSQNYPNPFNPATTISFSIPEASNVTMKIYNILGQEVKTLVSQEMSAGAYKVNFDASNLASGVYIYSLRAGNYTATKKMMLLK